MKKEPCTSNDSLNKKAFLSMLGAKKFIKPNINNLTYLKNQEIKNIKKLLEDNQGNKQVTASLLGITVSSLKRKLNTPNSIVETISDDQLASPNPARRYFENLKIDWKITSFDYNTREVCINLKESKCVLAKKSASNVLSCSPPVNLSATVSSLK
jgi:hypothetical protein